MVTTRSGNLGNVDEPEQSGRRNGIACGRPMPDHAAEQPRLSLLGNSGLIVEAAGPLDLDTQTRIWALAEAAAAWEEVREAVPGMTNLMLVLRSRSCDIESLKARIAHAWSLGRRLSPGGKEIEIPITYGGEGGPHLHEAASLTGLSIDEVVAIHSAPLYTVFAVGSHPGYCYLAGLDARLFTPRRSVPLVNLPGGSLSIAGMQTGVSASAGPSGWNTIGATAIQFFDVARDPPTLLQPGDRVRFRPERVIR